MTFERWQQRTFGTLLTESRIPGSTGAVAKKITVRLYGKGAVAKDEARSGSESTKYYRRSAGQLIYSKLDFLNGAFAILPESLDGRETTLDLPAFDISPEVDAKWLLAILAQPSFYESFSGSAKGSRKARRVNPGEFLSTTIAVPPPREQKKIAAVLCSVDDVIVATQAVIDQLQVVKKAMLAELLTRGLPGQHTRFKQTEIGEVPDEWDVVPFEQVLAEEDSLSYGIVQPGDNDPSGIPMLRTVDLDEHGGRSETVVLRVSRRIEAQYERTRLHGGEVLLSVMGTVGRTVVVPPQWSGWNVNRALAVVRVNGTVAAEFLSFWLRSPSTQDRFAVEQIGSAQKRVNLGDLRKMLVPVPKAKKEQARLCAVFSACDQRLARESQALAGMRTFKSALMSVLLTGEVRVKTDEEAA